jgi:hypothetical protein
MYVAMGGSMMVANDKYAYTGGKRRRDRLIPTPWPENSDTLTAKSDSLYSRAR